MSAIVQVFLAVLTFYIIHKFRKGRKARRDVR